MPQQLRMDPKLWNRIRIVAFSRGESATALVARVMENWLDSGGEEDKPQSGVAKGSKETVNLTLTTKGELLYDGPAVFTPDKPKEPMPWDESKFKGNHAVAVLPGGVVIDPLADNPARPQDAFAPPAVIKDPKEVGAAIKAVAPGREFHPVPKPASTKRTRR